MPPVAVLFTGLLATSEPLLAAVRASLEAEWGPVAQASIPRPWTETDYYEAEMGKGLVRQFLAFERLVGVDRLQDLKRRSVALEETFKPGASVARPVNIDPGLLGEHSLTLASTKRAGHRVWIGEGIWAEITVVYRDGAFQLLHWTYPDFRRPATLEFLAACRKLFLPRLR
ncbi:MAG: GTP-binding [Planctomycetota bacterium]|nr:MAG: GTP-binding [Planctomycetota bacterium]